MLSPGTPLHPLEMISRRPTLGSRELFPSLSSDVYLAHAAISPASLLVEAATRQFVESMAKRGTGGFGGWLQQRERLRSTIAGFLRVDAEDIALSSGCTRGVSDVALALPWNPGETLLTFRGEFPGNVVPWQQAATLRRGNVDFLEPISPSEPQAKARILETVRRALREAPKSRPVRFLAVSAVQFQTGLAMPLRELSLMCQEYDVYFLVDGIQGCGVVPYDLDDLGVDAFFSGAHKWLLGLEGAGFLTTSKRLRSLLEPLTAGWLSYQDGEKFLFQGAGQLSYERELLTTTRVFEGSTSNAVGFAALEAGLATCAHLGPEAIFAHVQNYHDALEPGIAARGFRSLRAADPVLRSCILSFQPIVPLELSELSRGLSERGIVVSIPDGLLRLAPHYSNDPAREVPLILAALDDVLAEPR